MARMPGAVSADQKKKTHDISANTDCCDHAQHLHMCMCGDSKHVTDSSYD